MISGLREITGSSHDYDGLLELIGDAHYVLIGEASHGTHEFYRDRAEITKRLIAEKGFEVPQSERMSHDFFASLPRQFDAVIHYDEAPETYPSAS